MPKDWQCRLYRLIGAARSLHLAVLSTLLLFTLLGTAAEAGDRVALVIGNGDYRSSALQNPVNDARDISRALQKYGFQVATRINADQRAMEEAIDSFYRSLRRAEVGFFYYAGHGMQIDGHNYLIPVKSKIASASDVKYRSVDAGIVLGKMQDAGNKVNIVVLDACRDNPFRSFVRSSTQGLAPMSVPAGTILSYATAANSVAADGQGRNGLYTEQLLNNLNDPSLDVLSLFNKTALEVRRKTDEKQQPFIYFNGLEPIYLAGGKPDQGGNAGGSGHHAEPAQDMPGITDASPPVQGSRSYIEPVTGMEFVTIPGGCFQMGSDISEEDRDGDEGPVHEVCLDPFAMGKYEVTVGQWRKFVSDSGYRSEAEKDGAHHGCYVKKGAAWSDFDGNYWDSPGFVQSDQQPVSCVSYKDVQEFIRWIKRKSGKQYRLPTEAEWEYAARAGTSTIRYWGDSTGSRACTYGNVADEASGWKKKYNFPCDDGYRFSSPVGSFIPNDFGLYDMLGNAWEWTGDWYQNSYYGKSPRSNPAGPSSGSDKVIRGGSWLKGPAGVRVANRGRNKFGKSNWTLGFRLVHVP